MKRGTPIRFSAALTPIEGRDGFYRLPVVPQGVFQHPEHGRLDFSRPRLDQLVANFRAGIETRSDGRVPITPEHDHDSGALGWIHDLELGEDGLAYAVATFTPEGLAEVQSGKRPYVSPEWIPDYPGVEGPVLTSAGLCIDPFFQKELPPLVMQATAPGGIVFVPAQDGQRMTTATTPTAGPAATRSEAAGSPGVGEPRNALGSPEVESLQAKVAHLERNERLRGIGDELRQVAIRATSSGPTYRLAPVAQSELATALADAPPAAARKVIEALRGIGLYPEGEIGLATAPTSSSLTPEQDATRKKLGLTVDEYRAGMIKGA